MRLGLAGSNPLLGRWSATLARRGGAVAVWAGDGRALRTFAEIEAEAESLTRLFDGMAPGSVVGVQLSNRPEWPALLLRLWRAGLVPLPIGGQVAAGELAAIVEDVPRCGDPDL